MGSTTRELKGRCGFFFFLLLVVERSISQRPAQCRLQAPAQAVQFHSRGRDGARQHGAEGLCLRPAAAVEASVAGDCGLLGCCSMSGGYGLLAACKGP